ncbi:AGAP007989-PA, partial [Anopheles gambiae str. PEST]
FVFSILDLLAYYKGGEQRTAPPVTNNRPTLAKLSMPVSARNETDPKIGQARMELETLANKPAFSAEERCRVLEAKDRYIRLTTERTTDIRKAKNIVGTCPDMCPEKERYLREWKCMVPSYERQTGGGAQIDHVKAIKQYSRSSADQELPLPHELRSQQALGRTMHFLLTHLADLCNDDEGEGGGNVSDWFHYIWDRTRGIRKDITQQDLCSVTVVELVEQCTRFHIHCAARLVSEDPSVFDQKINTENMTKCLQTLKYMYTDLGQRGQRCPAEAEFRAYMVLLYLNDGNFLWELRQLPEAIIHSKEIQFALSVYFALEENNFVRFFQLVRSTTYMNACILLRYFTQVRQKALEILRKAYAVRSTASFSLEYMTRILGFEDEEQAEAFFDHYGIMIDQTTDMVLFEPRQMNFYQPELPFPTSRAVRLVESKRTVSVGEAICGRPLEQWELQLPMVQPPNDSFDESGCLKEEVLQNVFADRRLMEPDAPNEPMADDRLFKVPSPTTVVPRLSPRARTPPTKPVPAPFPAEQNATPALPPPVFGTIGAKTAPSSVETAGFKTSTEAPSSFSFANAFAKPVFGTPPSTGNAPANSSVAEGAELLPSSNPSGGSLFGSANSFGGTALFGKAPSMPAAFGSSPALTAGFFQQPLKERNDNRENVGIPVERKEPNVDAEIEKQREKLKQEEEKRKQEKLLEERKQAVERASTVELEKLIDLVVEELVPEIAEAALDRQKRIQRTAVDVFNELVAELLTSHVTKTAEQEIERVERLRAARVRKLSMKYFHRWHRNAKSAARWRRLMRTVPPSFVNGSIRMDELPRCDQLRPFLNARCTGSKRSVDSVLQDQSVLREVFLFDAFPERKLIDPFVQLEGMINQLQQMQVPTRILGIAEPIYWKLVLSLPVEGEEGSAGFPSFVKRWLECCAFRKENREENHPYFYLAKRSPPSKQMLGTKTHSKGDGSQGQRAICMRLLQGQSLISEKDTDRAEACVLTDGVLFFLSDRCQIEQARNRLKSILTKCGSHQPSIAVILYCPNTVGAESSLVSVDSFEQNLGLAAGIVKRWRVFLWSRGTENDTLREAVHYLAHCYRAQMQFEPPRYEERLEMRPLNDFLERCVGSELWFRFDKSCRQSRGYLLAGKNANAIVELYNTAISKVQAMVSQDLNQFVRLPEEFGKLRDQASVATTRTNLLPLPEAYFPPDWNDTKRKNQLIQLLKPLKLHPLPDKLRKELNEYLSSYRVPLAENPHELSALTQQFLQGIASQLAGYAYNTETRPKERFGENVRRCYWVPLLALISETILRVLLKRAEGGSSLPHEVCYRRIDFLHHTETVWWKAQLQQIQKEALGSIEASRSNTPDTLAFGSDTSFSDSIRSANFHKRPKIVNGVIYSREIVDDVIAQGMRALVRAEELLSQKQNHATELQRIFKPLETTIQEVEQT